MSNITSLKFLLKEDQDNIKLYKQDKINLDEFSKRTNLTTAKFTEWLNTNDVPNYKFEEEEEYVAFVALLLHSGENLMSKALDSFTDKIRPKDRAYLIDKIKVLKNEPQIYGTQYKGISNGKVNFLPMADSENLNRRRTEVGLEPIEDYERKILSL